MDLYRRPPPSFRGGRRSDLSHRAPLFLPRQWKSSELCLLRFRLRRKRRQKAGWTEWQQTKRLTGLQMPFGRRRRQSALSLVRKSLSQGFAQERAQKTAHCCASSVMIAKTCSGHVSVRE